MGRFGGKFWDSDSGDDPWKVLNFNSLDPHLTKRGRLGVGFPFLERRKFGIWKTLFFDLRDVSELCFSHKSEGNFQRFSAALPQETARRLCSTRGRRALWMLACWKASISPRISWG